MKEELTTKMHSEFTISDATQRKHDAFAVFQLVSGKISLDEACSFLDMSREQVLPYVAAWNSISTKKIIL